VKKKIAIIKLKSKHDIQWYLPEFFEFLFRILGSRYEQLKGKSFMPQITPYYLAALAKEYDRMNNYDILVIDDYPENIKVTNEYDMVWFTTMTTTVMQVYKKADEFREKGVKIVLGGIHPSMLPEEAKHHADSVATGEGEKTIPLILHDFLRGQLKDFYRGGITKNLEKLPTPLWELGDGNYAQWVLPVQTSRGCGNACDFCSTTRFQGALRRHRPVEDIINELRSYIEKGTLNKNTAVFFTDNNTVADTNYRKGIFDTSYAKSLFKSIAQLRKEMRIEFDWIGQGELNMADDEELLELSAKSGCITQLIGYESLSQKNIDSQSKIGNQVSKYLAQTKKIHDYGIQIIGCFVFGMPNDEPDVFDKTYDFIKKHIDIPQVSLLTPYPGTKLYRRAKEKELILHENWEKYDLTHVTMKPEIRNEKGKKMTFEELETRYTELVKKVYNWKNIFLRSLKAANRYHRYNYNPRSWKEKFISVMAPNIIYRDLSLIDRR
jgi:radical SAM superfamily enzyme YgiQ (UPF0313 family)